MKVFLLLIGAIYFANGYIIVPEKCPVVSVVQNSEEAYKKLIGGWYVLKLFENKFDKNSKCLFNKIEHFDINSYKSTYFGISIEDDKKFRLPVSGTRKSNSTGIDFNFTLNHKNEDFLINVKVLVLEDDYFIAWGCTEVDGDTIRYSYIQAKQNVLPANKLKLIQDFYDKHNLGWSYLKDVDHENCT